MEKGSNVSQGELYCKCKFPKRKPATVAIFRASVPEEDDYDICEICKKECQPEKDDLLREFDKLIMGIF